MKIELYDAHDVEEFVAMLSPAFLRHCNKELSRVVDTGICSSESTRNDIEVTRELLERRVARDILTRADTREAATVEVEVPDGLPGDIESPVLGANELAARDIDPPLGPLPYALHVANRCRDVDGVQHNTDWHSDPAKLNADGRWRARRKRDEAAYAEWLEAMRAEASHADNEPVATETHALPQDETDEPQGADPASDQVRAADPTDPGATVDLEALVSDSLEAAQDASDSHINLLNACREFTSEHGHPAFTALKAAVAPDKTTGQGKAVQQFTPEERRLMQACIANYPA